MNPTVIHVVCGILHHAWHFIAMVGLNVKQELQLLEIFSEANGSSYPMHIYSSRKVRLTIQIWVKSSSDKSAQFSGANVSSMNGH